MLAMEVGTNELYWLTLNNIALPKHWIFECVPLEPTPDPSRKKYVRPEEVEGFEDISNW